MNSICKNKLAGFVFGVLTTISAGATIAEEFRPPSGDVLLTITGEIEVSNVEEAVALDLAGLEELESVTFTTSTIWTEGDVEFSGVPLATLVQQLGIQNGSLKATAINDYSIEIPVEEALKEGAIIAYRMNGELMSIRDKGPLWIVYPYDNNAKYRSEIYYARSIWQLDRISVIN